VRYLPPTNLFLLMGFYVCANFGENPSRNASVRVHERRTHGQRHLIFGFNIICPMLYGIAMGQIIAEQLKNNRL